MPQGKKQTAGDRRAGPHGDPKLPHERDQTTGSDSTADSTGSGNAELMKKAKADLDSGKQDTDRGPVTDATYHALRKGAPKK